MRVELRVAKRVEELIVGLVVRRERLPVRRAEVRVEAPPQVEGPAEGPAEVQAGEAERGH